MASLGKRWASLRENVKKEAESIEAEQASAIDVQNRKWSERVSAARNTIEAGIRELDESLKADLAQTVAGASARIEGATRKALEGIVHQHLFVMWLWGRTIAVFLAWLALLALFGTATFYLRGRTRARWGEFQRARAAIETLEASRVTYESNGALYVQAERVRGVFQSPNSGTWYVPAELSRDKRGLFVRAARR